MMEDLLGNMKAQQAELELKLKTIILTHEQDGISIEIDASKEILNVSVDEQLLTVERKEELEDLLVINLNRAIAIADEKQHAESATLLNNIVPGGLGGIFGG